MPLWSCKQCEKFCTVKRDCDPYFKPNNCIYSIQGNGVKKAQWEKVV